MKFSTRAIHAGQPPDASTGSVIVPIYQTSTYVQDKIGKHRGYEYSRTDNPTRHALEKCIATLENGKYGLAFASGMAAISAVMSCLKTGDHVVVTDDIYGGTFRFFEYLSRHCKLKFSYVEAENIESYKRAVREDTKMIWIETPTNPLLRLVDIKAVSRVCRKGGLILAVDNTFASPVFQNPLDFGADLVVHSTTKYIGGHSDIIGGVVVTSSEKLHENIKYYQNTAGAVPSPFDCWLVLRGVKTLELRMKKHEANALKIAQFLSSRREVESVSYPGLKKFAQVRLASSQMRGFGGMVTFKLKGDFNKVKVFIKRLKLFTLAESLGGVESLVCHPARMTHASIPKAQREKRRITENLIRLSVGIEDAEDLIGDLKTALNKLNN